MTLYALTPAPDGATTKFSAPVAVSPNGQLFGNGELQSHLQPSLDYMFSGQLIVFFSPPLLGDTLVLYS